MTAPAWRPPEAFVHGIDGVVVVVPARIAAWMDDRCKLANLRRSIRGADSEVDAVLVAIALAASAWRISVTGSSAAPIPEVAASSWLSTTNAATTLGITDRAVRLAIKQRRLPAEQVDGRWRIARTDVEHYRAGRRQR